MTFVDPYAGRRRINPETGRIEVNMGGRPVFVHGTWEDNWQPDPDMPWEQRDKDGNWKYPNLRELAYPDEKTEAHHPSKWGDAVGLAKDYLARVDVTRNTANPAASFIKDPTGSGKLIKFTHPLDLRSVEQKMQGYPFNQL